MKLEMEELEDFFKLFEGKEAETPMFIGQLNYHGETTMSVDVVVTTRYVDDGEVTIVSYKKDCGVAKIPTAENYELEKKELENLDVLAETMKKEMEAKLSQKGFETFRGMWTDGSQI